MYNMNQCSKAGPSAPPYIDQLNESLLWVCLDENAKSQEEKLPQLYPDIQSMLGQKYNWETSHPIRNVNPPSDVVDDEPAPSAPNLDLLDKVTGYEDASFEVLDIPPPLVPNSPKTDVEQQRSPLPSIPVLTESEARHALLKHASRHLCFGKAVARDMAITKIEHSSAFHYTLETFTEKRQTAWAYEAYSGGPVDGPSAGPAPGAWEVHTAVPNNFQNGSTQEEVPHTASVKMCHTCGGVGRKRCFTCTGNGWEYCHSCQGDGQKNLLQGEVERCFVCNGTGRKKCWKCNGDGMAVCRACAGTGQIKCFIQLTIIWTNHVDDHVVERTSLPEDKVKLVSGQLVFEEEQPWVWPINHFPDNTVNTASMQLVQKHASKFPMEKMIIQRHRVRIVPVSTAHFQWNNTNGTFTVYGFEKKVHAPGYPQKYCCGCVVL